MKTVKITKYHQNHFFATSYLLLMHCFALIEAIIIIIVVIIIDMVNVIMIINITLFWNLIGLKDHIFLSDWFSIM